MEDAKITENLMSLLSPAGPGWRSWRRPGDLRSPSGKGTVETPLNHLGLWDLFGWVLSLPPSSGAKIYVNLPGPHRPCDLWWNRTSGQLIYRPASNWTNWHGIGRAVERPAAPVWALNTKQKKQLVSPSGCGCPGTVEDPVCSIDNYLLASFPLPFLLSAPTYASECDFHESCPCILFWKPPVTAVNIASNTPALWVSWGI